MALASHFFFFSCLCITATLSFRSFTIRNIIPVTGQIKSSITSIVTVKIAPGTTRNPTRYKAFQPLTDDMETNYPPAIFLAGFDESHLESIDDVLINVLAVLPPIIIICDQDLQRNMSYFLFNNNLLNDRDHELPRKNLKLDIPIIVLSGFDRLRLRIIMQEMKALSMNQNVPKCLFALVVKPALEKPLRQLFDEILRDHLDNNKQLGPSS